MEGPRGFLLVHRKPFWTLHCAASIECAATRLVAKRPPAHALGLGDPSRGGVRRRVHRKRARRDGHRTQTAQSLPVHLAVQERDLSTVLSNGAGRLLLVDS